MSKAIDWVARIYDENDEVIDAWFIGDRAEKEARNEIEADIARLHPGKDWTLHEAEEMWGGQIRISIRGEVWIETHVATVHDVLQCGVQHAIYQEWDWASLRDVVRDAVHDHLAGQGLADTEVDAFERYLEIERQDLVKVEISVD